MSDPFLGPQDQQLWDYANATPAPMMWGDDWQGPTRKRETLPQALYNVFVDPAVQMVKDVTTAPGRAYRGELDPRSDEALASMLGLAGLATFGVAPMATAPRGSVLTAGKQKRPGGGLGGELPPLGAGLAAEVEAQAAERAALQAQALKRSQKLGDNIVPSEQLFDYSQLSRVPQVPQFDLPRYDPKRGVSQRVQDITADPQVREQMHGYIEKGRKMGGENWYNAEPLRQEFIRELGHNEGQVAFGRFMDYVAATSPRSDVGTNIRNASYYYQRERQGQAMPEIGTKNPQPYGHLAQRLHQQNAAVVAGPGWNVLKNPKPPSFSSGLKGNQTPVAVDTHAFRLPGMISEDPRFLATSFKPEKGAEIIRPQQMYAKGEVTMPQALERPTYWESVPNANEYGAMERYYQSLAREQGITPAQAQASAWVGGGSKTGLLSDESKPFMRFFEDRVHRTAQAYGIPPRDVLKRFIKGDLGLLALTGAAGAAAMPAAQAMLEHQEHPDDAPR